MADDNAEQDQSADPVDEALAAAQAAAGQSFPITVQQIMPFLSERQQDTVLTGVLAFKLEMLTRQNRAQADELAQLRAERDAAPKNRAQARAAAKKKSVPAKTTARKRAARRR